ncbi:DUF4226 domain-containing protein [Mycolicibacterium moriokaense]|nr:DUF4226 domain-containing protein [Mycolicibacterium moriokaense]
MTHPSVQATQSGEAVDAVRTLQSELSGAYSEMHSAEIQLTDAILSAHAVTVAGRGALQDIQRQLIEAINNPVAGLGTPAGERQFLLFLRSKIAEIQDIVDTGALTDEDHARLTRALGRGYLLSSPEPAEGPPPPTAPAGAAMTEQGAGLMPAVGSALGTLPQAAQGAAAAPAQGAGGLAGAATPLAGLASGLLDRGGHPEPAEDPADSAPTSEESDELDDAGKDYSGEDDAGKDTETAPEDEGGDTRDRRAAPQAPGDSPPPDDGPAQTRPARLL